MNILERKKPVQQPGFFRLFVTIQPMLEKRAEKWYARGVHHFSGIPLHA